MLSMTGYGTASVQVGSAAVVLEARALNHRFLDVRVRLPPALADYGSSVDEIARKQLIRGRVEVSARIEGALHGEVVLNRERARAAFDALVQLRDELGLDEPVPLSLLSAVPGLFAEQARDVQAMREAVEQAARAACRALQSMRRTEGAALAADLRGRLARVQELCGRIAERAGGLAERYRDKLRTRIAGLLASTGATLDPLRLEQEVALLVERSDASEELTRMDSHCRQFAALIDLGAEPVGRRLEFLLQEMGREVNTLGSKIDDLELTGCMLELKAELERMREQVQNVL